MIWIVTFQAKLTDDELVACLTEAGGTPPKDLWRIPLGEGEASVEIEADAATAEKLRAVPGIIGVWPSSELTLY